MVSDRMVTWNGNRIIQAAVRNDNRHHVGPVIIVSNETFIDHF